jgi:hypothetical protein
MIINKNSILFPFSSVNPLSLFPPEQSFFDLDSERGFLPSTRPNPTFLPPAPIASPQHTTPFPECSPPPKKPKWSKNIPQLAIYLKEKKKKKGENAFIFPACPY